MDLSRYLQLALTQFISNSVGNDVLQLIKRAVTPSDVIVLITVIESLDDPGTYCRNNTDDAATVSGFFLFIDFIAALIINLGDAATKNVQQYRNSKHPFVPWIIQYASDDRFHDEIMSKFDQIFTEWHKHSNLCNLDKC